MQNLVIGMGEVGTAVAEVLSERYKIQTHGEDYEDIYGKIDALHICFPYSDNFIKYVRQYMKRFDPLVVIIYSTVPVGTTKKLGAKVVHSPIEGKHPKLRRSTKIFTRFIGYNRGVSGTLAVRIWEPIVNIKLIPDSDYTEFLKLASTSKYGINIVWAQYMANCAKELGMDYQLVKDWDRAYNSLYKQLKLVDYRKFVLDAPEGPIGGHCVVPNAEILDERFPSDLLKMIKEMS
jgi:UDP-N-acetyl-D-mannosaminuronate dehydrogenase